MYQAQDSQGGASVAVRVFSAKGMARTVAETDLGQAARVPHKNLATLVAWGLEDNSVYVAAEAIDGATLRQIFDARRKEGKVIGIEVLDHVIIGQKSLSMKEKGLI